MWAARVVQVVGLAMIIAAIEVLSSWPWALLAAGGAMLTAGLLLEHRRGTSTSGSLFTVNVGDDRDR